MSHPQNTVFQETWLQQRSEWLENEERGEKDILSDPTLGEYVVVLVEDESGYSAKRKYLPLQITRNYLQNYE